jgi:hypothetical protein
LEEIIKEKVEFIGDNKDIIIDNLGVVGYDLFSILNNDKSLDDLKEYKKLLAFFNDKKVITNYSTKDELYILYYLSNFLERICMDFSKKENYRAKIFKYIEYFNKKNLNKNTYVKIKKKHS